jgi:hypothetical protein
MEMTNRIKSITPILLNEFKAFNFVEDDEDKSELSLLLSGLSSNDTDDSHSTREILDILDKRKKKFYSMKNLTEIHAPIPKKFSSNNNVLIERVSRPYDTL